MASEKKEQPVFGTSGLRGLAAALTDTVCGRHVQAFLLLQEPAPAGLLIGRDLRASSPRIAAAVTRAALSIGVRVWDCGPLPTPALALAAAESGLPAVMITGSHIPAERNGLKFLTAAGDIGKKEEARIAHLAAELPDTAAVSGATGLERDVVAPYRDRLVRFFGAGALKGCRIGIFQHSSVARDLLVDLVSALGAEADPFGRTDQFLPLDTEAVEDTLRRDLARRAADGGYDAVLSTDPDADRPLMVDDKGRLVAGDSLALLAARALGAEAIVT
ncbi:MAG: phosphomannomutase, partial [Paracoccaceae bacterium]